MDAFFQVLLKAMAVICAVGACVGTIAFLVLCDWLKHREHAREEK